MEYLGLSKEAKASSRGGLLSNRPMSVMEIMWPASVRSTLQFPEYLPKGVHPAMIMLTVVRPSLSGRRPTNGIRNWRANDRLRHRWN